MVLLFSCDFDKMRIVLYVIGSCDVRYGGLERNEVISNGRSTVV